MTVWRLGLVSSIPRRCAAPTKRKGAGGRCSQPLAPILPVNPETTHHNSTKPRLPSSATSREESAPGCEIWICFTHGTSAWRPSSSLSRLAGGGGCSRARPTRRRPNLRRPGPLPERWPPLFDPFQAAAAFVARSWPSRYLPGGPRSLRAALPPSAPPLGPPPASAATCPMGWRHFFQAGPGLIVATNGERHDRSMPGVVLA